METADTYLAAVDLADELETLAEILRSRVTPGRAIREYGPLLYPLLAQAEENLESFRNEISGCRRALG